MSASTPGTIRYTTNGDEPTEASPAYPDIPIEVPENTTVKARLYPQNTEAFTESDVSSIVLPVLEVSAISIGTELPDGSIVAYDRGSTYGDYGLVNGYPIRMSSGEDDGTGTSQYWRYLIIDSPDNVQNLIWGPDGIVEETDNKIGYGLPNSNLILQAISDYSESIWEVIIKKREETGFDWFVPSPREIIDSSIEEGMYRSDHFWSSSTSNEDYAYCYRFTGGGIIASRNTKYSFISFRRI